MCIIFKVFIEFVTTLFLFYVLVFWLQGMGDLSPLTRDQTHTFCIRRWNLNHWTSRKIQKTFISICMVRVITNRKYWLKRKFFYISFPVYTSNYVSVKGQWFLFQVPVLNKANEPADLGLNKKWCFADYITYDVYSVRPSAYL